MAANSPQLKLERAKVLAQLVEEAEEYMLRGQAVRIMPLEEVARRLNLTPQGLDLQLERYGVATVLKPGQNRNRLVLIQELAEAAGFDALTTGTSEPLDPEQVRLATKVMIQISDPRFSSAETMELARLLKSTMEGRRSEDIR
jgi:hypothetical protein